MLTLTRARKAAGETGTPLPTVFKTWADNGLHIRQGAFTLFAAAPGVGKSLAALTLSMRMGVPTYYFSADTNAYDMYVRAGAMLTGWSTNDVERQIKVGSTETIDAKLNANDHIRFNFDAAPSMDDIDEELQAFAAAYGEWPRLVIIDNLRNVFDPEADKGSVDGVCDFIHERARETNSAFIGLHHATGQYDSGLVPIPLDGLMGKVSKIPDQVVTFDRNPQLEFNGKQTMNCRPVKNRGGKADPSGFTSYPIYADMPRMCLEG